MIQQLHCWVYIRKKKNENTNLKKNMHCNIHNSIIYNSQDMEPTQMPITRWMNK